MQYRDVLIHVGIGRHWHRLYSNTGIVLRHGISNILTETRKKEKKEIEKLLCQCDVSKIRLKIMNV